MSLVILWVYKISGKKNQEEYPDGRRTETGSITACDDVCVCVQEFVGYFRRSLGRSVCWGDRMEFINGWYLVLIISDVLTIIASFIKIAIETKVPQFSLNTSAEFKKRGELIGGSLCSLESVVL